MAETTTPTPRWRFWRLKLAVTILIVLLAVTYIPRRFIPTEALRDLHQILVEARDRGFGRQETAAPDAL